MSKSKKKAGAQFDIALVGAIVAFDPETGDALHVHEEHMETIDGKPYRSTEITAEDCERIREEVVRSHPRRRIDVMSARPEDIIGGRPDDVISARPEANGLILRRRYHVDPMTRQLRLETEPDFHAVEQMARMGFGHTFRRP